MVEKDIPKENDDIFYSMMERENEEIFYSIINSRNKNDSEKKLNQLFNDIKDIENQIANLKQDTPNNNNKSSKISNKNKITKSNNPDHEQFSENIQPTSKMQSI
jgi:hypothetical protein